MATQDVMVDVSEDWAIACDVQQSFLERPKPRFHDLGHGARCRQVRAVGGDFYDLLPLKDDQVALAIGDASGKSIGAALMILSVHASLRMAASFAGHEPASVLNIVNSHTHSASPAGSYATLFYGVFDGRTRTLRYVNAGHNPPIIVGQDGRMVRLETGGAPAGMFPTWHYEEGVVQLCPGDLIVAYTDGISEAMNSAGEEWGIEGIRKAVEESEAKSPDEIASAIFRAMDEFSRGCQTDDATVLVARVQ